jgi:VWFA-related protein
MKRLLFFIAVTALAQEAPPLFTASTNNVIVDVAVTGDQRAAKGLGREDFIVLDNGQPTTIAGIAHDELPLDIVLVCQSPLRGPGGVWINPHHAEPFPDRSDIVIMPGGFVQESIPQRLMNAAANAVLGSRPGDRVAIVAYGKDPHITLRFTDNRKAIAAAIKRFGDPENAEDNIVLSSEAVAIEYGVRMLADVEKDDPNARANRRRLIILISTTNGTGTRYADEPVIRRLWEQNIVFSAIDYGPPSPSTMGVERSGGGESQTILFRRYNPIRIAQATGGDRIVTLDPQHPRDLLTPIRQRYTLWFNQPPDAPPGELRGIRVELSDAARQRFPDAMLKAREGYVTR